jgi:hypothetical protein
MVRWLVDLSAVRWRLEVVLMYCMQDRKHGICYGEDGFSQSCKDSVEKSTVYGIEMTKHDESVHKKLNNSVENRRIGIIDSPEPGA